MTKPLTYLNLLSHLEIFSCLLHLVFCMQFIENTKRNITKRWCFLGSGVWQSWELCNPWQIAVDVPSFWSSGTRSYFSLSWTFALSQRFMMLVICLSQTIAKCIFVITSVIIFAFLFMVRGNLSSWRSDGIVPCERFGRNVIVSFIAFGRNVSHAFPCLANGLLCCTCEMVFLKDLLWHHGCLMK